MSGLLLAPSSASAATDGPFAAKAPPPPPLDGNTYDFDYDGSDVGHPERAWLGRSFVHTKAANAAPQPLPLLVYLHGLNTELIRYRWMGGGAESDLRRSTAEMIEAEIIPPMIVAAPSTIDPATATTAALIWPGFDLDTFVEKTAERLAGLVTIDRSRIIVAGHSGAGCNSKGGLSTALKSKTSAFAGLIIDTCMRLDQAKALAHAKPTTHIVVSWQSITWADRPFDDFRDVFNRETKKARPPAGILRELWFEQPSLPSPHDAIVGLTLSRWLPVLLSAQGGEALSNASAEPTTDADAGAPR